MAGGSSSSSKPVDMTPQAYKNLQSPFAATLANLLGFGTQTTTTGAGVPVGGGTSTGLGSGDFSNKGTTPPPNVGGLNGMGGREKTIIPPTNTGGAQVPTTTTTYTANQNSDPNSILNGIPKYNGPLTADIAPNEQTILDQLMASGDNGALDFLNKLIGGQAYGNVGQITPQQIAAGIGAINYGQNGSTADPYGTMQFGQATNPLLDAYTQAQQRSTLEGLTETLTRDLPGRFTTAGQFIQPQGSSAFDRAAALASRGAANAMGDIATNIGYNAYQSDRALQASAINDQQNRILQALTGTAGNALTAAQSNQSSDLAAQTTNQKTEMDKVAGQQQGVQLQQQQVQSMINNLQAQALPRLIQEYGIERGMDVFNNQMQSLLQVLGITANVTQPTVSSESKSSTKPNVLPMLGAL